MKQLLIVILPLFLLACGTTPSTLHYYVLDQDTSAYQQNKPNIEVEKITLSKVILANYLQQPSLSIEQDDHKIYYANQHLWAEDLDSAIARTLTNDFNLSSNEHYMLSNSDPNASEGKYQLQVQLDHFSATQSASVILAGKYWILEGQSTIINRHFYFEKTLLQDGFSHSVSLQRQLLKQLAAQISITLQQNNT